MVLGYPFVPCHLDASLQICDQLDTEVVFLQEVQNDDGTWVNVDKALYQHLSVRQKVVISHQRVVQ